MDRARTMYFLCGIDGKYLYNVSETRVGSFEPDHHNGAYLERSPGKGKQITALYGPDLLKAKLFQSRDKAEFYMHRYSVLRFCSVFKVSAAKMREMQEMRHQLNNEPPA